MRRIATLDLARGFTVLFMPAIHTVMLYSKPNVQQSVAGNILAFIAEGPGAQVFMLIMGLMIHFSTSLSKKSVLQRAIVLMATAYALNFLKFVVPLLSGAMPSELLHELGLQPNLNAVIFFLSLGDILHFAAIAYPLLYLISLLKNYQWWSIAIAIAIIIIAPYTWDVNSKFIFVNYLLKLAGGHPPKVFFPLFPWLVYPLIGLSIGYWIKQFEINSVFKWVGRIGFILLLTSLLFPATKVQTDWPSFYRTEAPDTLFHLGFTLFWLTCMHWIHLKIPDNFFFKLLRFNSTHITSIYITQWIIIFWCLDVAGYHKLGYLDSVYWVAITSFLSFFIAWSLKFIDGIKVRI